MDEYSNIIKTISFTGKQIIIEKGGLNDGVYFVKIIDKNHNIFNKKIVVQ